MLLDGKTSEDDSANKTSTASYLDTRLTAICERTKLVVYVNKVNSIVDKLQEQLTDMSSRVSENGDLNSKIRDLETTLHDLNCAIYDGSVGTDGEKSQGIKDTINSLSKKVNDIDNTSDKIMPNIVTLLGVFSSIIIIILTLITTSSTWLSNANDVSVLIAFVVPSAIATLAICALTAFIRPLVGSDSDTIESQIQDKTSWRHKLCVAAKQTFQKWSLWLSVSVIALMVVFGTMWFCQEEEVNRTHYIVKCLPMSETIDHSDDVTAQPTVKHLTQSSLLHWRFFYPQETYTLKRFHVPSMINMKMGLSIIAFYIKGSNNQKRAYKSINNLDCVTLYTQIGLSHFVRQPYLTRFEQKGKRNNEH